MGSVMKTLAVVMLIALSLNMVFADEAELVVAKTVLTRNPIAGQEMMVSVRIFNVGSGYVEGCKEIKRGFDEQNQ